MSTCANPQTPSNIGSDLEWRIKKRNFHTAGNYTRNAPRAVAEGAGGSDGIVLPLSLVYSGSMSTSYVLNLEFGTSNPQSLAIQLDTGSSDLWVASTSCKTSTCQQANGNLYNGNSATQSGCEFSIKYISGQANGPIVWDEVTIGGYEIDNQALAAAGDVESEPLGSFSGVLGLALPANSVISSIVPAGTDSEPDGAVMASNLFSMGQGAPASRFLSLSLERPGSTTVPSMFGIGRHPSAVVSDPSLIKYSRVVNGGDATYFWETIISEIAVWVDGVRKEIDLTSSVTGAVLPTAILDTGVPVILTTSAIANGIYGALNIGPASDGNYYVPCTTPLNMTITVNNLLVPIHPLDLTQTSQNSDTCIGLIQAADSSLANIGDMVLGVPFMRNVYTVMAYTPPLSNGSFDPITPSESKSDSFDIDPRLGLLNLTDPTIAMQEFLTVRVQGKPLSPGGDGSNGGRGSSSSDTTSHHGLSIGLKIFIGLISGFALIVAIFLGRFLWQRRNWKKTYQKTHTKSLDDGAEAAVAMEALSPEYAGETLRELQFEEYMKRKGVTSDYTVDSARTRVEEDVGEDEMMMDEFGLVYFSKKGHDREGSYSSSMKRTTLVGDDRDATPAVETPSHRRLPSNGPQLSEPLLTAMSPRESYFPPIVESPQIELDLSDLGELGELSPGTRDSMAGVGTRGTRRLASDEFSTAAMSRLSNHRSLSPPAARPPRPTRPSSTLRHTREPSIEQEQEGGLFMNQ